MKNKLFYLVLLLGVFLTPIFKFTLQAQEVYDLGVNLASPNLEGKEYLGDGWYELNSKTKFNVFTGYFTINGSGRIDRFPFIYQELSGSYTVSYEYISGDLSGSRIGVRDYVNYVYMLPIELHNYKENLTSVYSDTGISIGLYANDLSVYDNLTFKIQLEKGTTATPYKLPIQALKQHVQLESDRAYNDGFDEGYFDGFDDGYDLGHFDGKDVGHYQGYQEGYDYGYDLGYDGGLDVGYNNGYNQARDDYGYYDDETGEWITAAERHQVFYDRGYRDGIDDTNDYYNDNGLFIPQLTPKGHLVVEADSRYGDPYFYLQDFSGMWDSAYFEFDHNRWLEKAFEWAYSVESDFLAINDIYTIKYKNDEVLYKYFFYRYDTDSIYLYDDNGTLQKIVERSNFDYFVYETVELSPEEQDRVDRAYDSGYNKAKSEYGYYDSVSEEYLTAIEYGEIQYNKGVISIRDKAYLDGFYTAMMDSHKYGFDWVRATYTDLIVERPSLLNLRDETSFTYQLAYTQGFNVAREQYGYWNGSVWITAGSIREFTYPEAFDEGFRKATNELYDDIHDEIYDIGYRDGQRAGMNNKFYTGLEKWLVPAIIVVLFFGLLMLFPRNKED